MTYNIGAAPEKDISAEFAAWSQKAISDLISFNAQRLAVAAQASNKEAIGTLTIVNTTFIPALSKNRSRVLEDAKRDPISLPAGIQSFRNGLQSIQGVVEKVDVEEKSKVLSLLSQLDEIYKTSYAEAKRLARVAGREVKELATEVASGAGEVAGSFWDSGGAKVVVGLGVLGAIMVAWKILR